MAVRYILKIKYVVIFVVTLITSSVFLSGCTSAPANTDNATPVTKLVWVHSYDVQVRWIGSVINTSDNGFAILGTSILGPNLRDDLDTTHNVNRMCQMYLIKTDADGKVLWDRTYGEYESGGAGSGESLIQTRDGGYAIIGLFGSLGTVLLKTDADGNVTWYTPFSFSSGYGTQADSITQSDDGGYVITGGAGPSSLNLRVFMAKFDANGKMVWNKTYMQGSGTSIIRTIDNGYAVLYDTSGDMQYDPGILNYACPIDAETIKTPVNNAGIIKTDANGDLAWNKTFTFNPAADNDNNLPSYMTTKGKSILQTSDGGYAISGTTGNFRNTYMNFTYFMIKVDASGSEIWRHTYGGPGNMDDISAVRTDDGYAILGIANDYSIKYSPPEDLSKYLTNRIILIKIDANGAEAGKNDIWSGMGYAVAVAKTNDSGLAVAGISTENILENTINNSYKDSNIFLAKFATSAGNLSGSSNINTGNQYNTPEYLINTPTPSPIITVTHTPSQIITVTPTPSPIITATPPPNPTVTPTPQPLEDPIVGTWTDQNNYWAYAYYGNGSILQLGWMTHRTGDNVSHIPVYTTGTWENLGDNRYSIVPDITRDGAFTAVMNDNEMSILNASNSGTRKISDIPDVNLVHFNYVP